MTKFALTNEQVEVANTLLSDPKLDLPPFRREIRRTGVNFDWLKANIQKRNKDIDPKLLELLGLSK